MKNWLVTIVKTDGETVRFESCTPQGGPARDVKNGFKYRYPGAKITVKEIKE